MLHRSCRPLDPPIRAVLAAVAVLERRGRRLFPEATALGLGSHAVVRVDELDVRPGQRLVLAEAEVLLERRVDALEVSVEARDDDQVRGEGEEPVEIGLRLVPSRREHAQHPGDSCEQKAAGEHDPGERRGGTVDAAARDQDVEGNPGLGEAAARRRRAVQIASRPSARPDLQKRGRRRVDVAGVGGRREQPRRRNEDDRVTGFKKLPVDTLGRLGEEEAGRPVAEPDERRRSRLEGRLRPGDRLDESRDPSEIDALGRHRRAVRHEGRGVVRPSRPDGCERAGRGGNDDRVVDSPLVGSPPGRRNPLDPSGGRQATRREPKPADLDELGRRERRRLTDEKPAHAVDERHRLSDTVPHPDGGNLGAMVRVAPRVRFAESSREEEAHDAQDEQDAHRSKLPKSRAHGKLNILPCAGRTRQSRVRWSSRRTREGSADRHRRFRGTALLRK